MNVEDIIEILGKVASAIVLLILALLVAAFYLWIAIMCFMLIYYIAQFI